MFNQVRAKSWVTSAAVVIAIFSFVFSGFLRRGNRLQEHVLARVDDWYVSVDEFQMALQDESAREDGMLQQGGLQQGAILERLVQDKVTTHYAHLIGLKIGDEEVAQWITEQEIFQKNGQFDIKLYQQFLSQNMSEFELLRLARDSVMQNKFQQLQKNLTYISPIWYQWEQDLLQHSYWLSAAQIQVPMSLIESQLSEEAEKMLSTSLEKIQEHYDKNLGTYHQKAQVELQVIQIPTQNENCDHVRPYHKRLLHSFENWDEISQQVSVHENKAQKGYIGWVELEQFQGAKKDLLQQLPRQKVSDIFQEDQTCWIFYKKDEKPEIHKSFDEAKTEIARQLAKPSLMERLNFELKTEFEKIFKTVRDKVELVQKVEEQVKKWNLSWSSEDKVFPVHINDFIFPRIGVNLELAKYLPALRDPGDVLPIFFRTEQGTFIVKLIRKGPIEYRGQEASLTEDKRREIFISRLETRYWRDLKSLLTRDYKERKKIDYNQSVSK